MIPNHFQGNVIRVAKVLKSHSHGNTHDLIFLDNLAKSHRVQTLQSSAGSDYGRVDIPAPTPPKDEYDPNDTGDRDIYAVVAMAGKQPVILGYIYPQVNQMAFHADKYPNMKLERHASDTFHVTSNDGSHGIITAGGTKILIGTPPTNLDGQDFDKKWKLKHNTSDIKQIVLDIPQRAIIHMAPDGNIVISSLRESVNISASKDIRCVASKIFLN